MVYCLAEKGDSDERFCVQYRVLGSLGEGLSNFSPYKSLAISCPELGTLKAPKAELSTAQPLQKGLPGVLRHHTCPFLPQVGRKVLWAGRLPSRVPSGAWALSWATTILCCHSASSGMLALGLALC